MPSRIRSFFTSPSLRRRLLLAGLAGLAVWLLLLDSHSILKRAQYARERSALQEEVARLRDANEALEGHIRAGLTDEVVEEIAREQYGMRRAGETVYPVEEL